MTMTTDMVTRNWGDGFVAARMNGKTWIITERIAAAKGLHVPAPVETIAYQPQLDRTRGEVYSSMRVPFWRRLGPAKRGRRK